MQSDWEMGLLWYGVFVVSTVLHEAAHAWTAFKLGDDTAARGGQVTLNPIPHIRREPFGMVVVPVLSWLAGGWLIGWASAPFNPEWARRFPKHAALMALAGPAANLLLVIGAAWFMRIGIEWGWFAAPQRINSSRLVVAAQSGWFEQAATGASVLLSLNLLLFVFNLLPLPPLDGSNAPLLLLPTRAAEQYAEFLRAPMFRVIGVLVASRLLGPVFPSILRLAANLIHPHAHYY